MTARLILADDASAPPLQVTARAAEPASPAANDIYLDDGTNTASGEPGWRQYDGADWNDLNGAVQGFTQGARVYHNADQSMANDTNTALAFNSERYDTDTIHDTSSNNSRLTCQTAGKYMIVGNLAIQLHATGARQLMIRLNGSTIIALTQVNGSGSLSARLSVSTIYDLAETDYVELIGYQNSGGALNALAIGNYTPEFMMQRIG